MLEQLLVRPKTRLVTVTGPGGVGKTRIATELTPRLNEFFPDAIWIVPLAHVHDPELVLGAIAAGLGIRDLDAGETTDRIADRLGRLKALLVLDNLEQVIESGPAIARLLQATPALTILATSRQPMQLQGEIEYPLRPLPFEAPNGLETPAEALFAARAREASYGFSVSDENREAVRAIARRLEGLPLAIELAASWVKVLPPQRLLANLDRQLDVLVRGPLDLPQRQQTMRSAIAWSDELLAPPERTLLRQLSVFSGPFTLSDVESVARLAETAGSIELSELALLETLASLVTKNLVQVSDDAADPAEPEYRMLEIIRAYAAERLAEAGETSSLRDRHMMYFTRLAEHWTSGLASAQRDARLAQLDREYPNFRAALEWAIQSRQGESALRLVAALWLYWDWRGFHAEGARWCDRVLAMDSSSDPALLSSALYAGAAIAFMQANYARSTELAEACLSSAEESADDAVIARALVALGNATYDQGQLDRSEAIYARSLTMSRRASDDRSLQVSLVNLGYVFYQQDRFDEALGLFEEAVALESRTGQSSGASWARVGRALCQHRRGHLAVAEAHLVELIDRQRVADTGQLAAALTACASLLRAQGRIAESEPLVREAIANRVARDERALLTDSLSELAALALCAGAAGDGVALAGAVAAQRQRIGYHLPEQEWRVHQELIENARHTLGAEAFQAEWARGERMTSAETIAFADALRLGAVPVSPPIPSASPAAGMLTPREREVLVLITDGRTDREIAHALAISPGTASRHVANILHKLDVRSRSAAAAWAIRNGVK